MLDSKTLNFPYQSQGIMLFDVYDEIVCSGVKKDDIARFIAPSKELLESFGVQNVAPKIPLKPYSGYFASIKDSINALKNMAYNFAIAQSQDCVLLFVEEDVCTQALLTLEAFLQPDTQALLIDFLRSHNLSFDPNKPSFVTLDWLIAKKSADGHCIFAKSFKQYKSTLLRTYGFVPLDLATIFRALELTIVPSSDSYFCHLLESNATLAKQSLHRQFFTLVDLGIDFFSALSISQFFVFDRLQGSFSPPRDCPKIPVFSLAELCLLALDKPLEKRFHKVAFEELIG